MVKRTRSPGLCKLKMVHLSGEVQGRLVSCCAATLTTENIPPGDEHK